MKIANAPKYALGIFAAAGILAGCSSGSQTPLGPSTGTQSVARTVPITAARIGIAPSMRIPDKSWISPDARRHHRKFAYIGQYAGSDVLDFHFPKGELLGTLSGLTNAQGGCTKTGRGTYWIAVTGNFDMDEFDVGGTTPIATLSTSSVGFPVGCAINKATGDLAATIIGTGDVVIFKNGSGSGTTMSDTLTSTFFDGYDSSGDLFVDGESGSRFAFAELPNGSSSFKTITLSNSPIFPGGVQWDGKYITVNDQSGFAIYQYTVSGSTGTLEGTVSYSGASDCDQTYIYKAHFVCPNAYGEDVLLYNYPAGGAPVETWSSGSFDTPLGSVVVEK